MIENSAGIFIHQKWKTNSSLVITTITQISRDMETSKDRIKIKITITATTIDKEVGITHREDGIVIGTRDMIIR